MSLLGCDSARVYEENVGFPNEIWNADKPAVFTVPVKDTVSRHRFFFNLRNTGQYPYSNMFLFLTTIYPDTSFSVDTIELMLADPSGNWLGAGSGGIYENKILFKNNVIFPDTGNYTFTVTQGMRMEELPHVLDIGLRIEKQ